MAIDALYSVFCVLSNVSTKNKEIQLYIVITTTQKSKCDPSLEHLTLGRWIPSLHLGSATEAAPTEQGSLRVWLLRVSVDAEVRHIWSAGSAVASEEMPEI